MNSPEVGRQIRTIREQCGSRLFVGAGTVTSSAELGVALEAGAQFIVSPVTDVGLVAECVRRGVPVFPGAVTPTEILQAWSAGATMVKLFPAAQLGPGYVSAVKGPLDQVPLLPTGGITLENAREFLDAGAAGFGVGSPLFQKARMADRQWDWLRERIAAFRDLWPRTRD
jgi:2-dehydro-3-deoxyphosphogluconate aldolase/(4S)-4-hydroxy-2-oxoglutarate aldolase